MLSDDNKDRTELVENIPVINHGHDETRSDHMLSEHSAVLNQRSAEPTTKPSDPHVAGNTPGVLILQWLTYAFWGWTLVALYWLTGLSVNYFVDHNSQSSYEYDYSLSDSNTFLAYALAAVIVLFLVSIVCDIVYSKFEPRRKTGAATVIMIIHAVIFALSGIGSLIVGVFALVNMLVSGDDIAGATTFMITSIIMTILYGLTLLRTLNIAKIKHATQIYWVIMTLATLGIIGLGLFGPVAYTQRTKDDKALERGLPDLADAINQYALDNKRLPKSLHDTSLQQSYYFESNDVKRIVNEDLVQYIPKDKVKNPTATLNTRGKTSINTPDQRISQEDSIYHYQLCATYDYKDTSGGYDTPYRSKTQQYQEYETTPNTDGHPAEKVCYDLQTDYNNIIY